ncbi:MAG: 1,4-alpha-glucan branching enzyme, partial [Nitrospira sp.]|nr:1,4-alpha-glucan branching enzyme [Nitrospira sp.]
MTKKELREQIKLIVEANHWDPFQVLGMHIIDEAAKRLAVRTFLPEAQQAWVVNMNTKKTYPMEKVHQDGFFESIIEKKTLFPYLIRIKTYEGDISEFYDPYSFLPVLTDFDLHLIGEGTHYRKYEKLGAHVMEINGIRGVHFAVWAPNARRVSVIGDFNRWDGRRHPMRVLGSSGVWELFIPSLKEGDLYKFEIKSRFKKYITVKADPYAFYFELRPKSASIVYDMNRYQWNDSRWIEMRQKKNWLESPLAIYEVHLGSWMRVPDEGNRFITYREAAEWLVSYVKGMG